MWTISFNKTANPKTIKCFDSKHLRNERAVFFRQTENVFQNKTKLFLCGVKLKNSAIFMNTQVSSFSIFYLRYFKEILFPELEKKNLETSKQFRFDMCQKMPMKQIFILQHWKKEMKIIKHFLETEIIEKYELCRDYVKN